MGAKPENPCSIGIILKVSVYILITSKRFIVESFFFFSYKLVYDIFVRFLITQHVDTVYKKKRMQEN